MTITDGMFPWHTAKYLWVYGTLRRGEGNHEAYLAGRTRFAGEASCPGRLYTVKDCYPVLELSGEAPVRGELYEPVTKLRAVLFRDLDRLEGIDEGYYRGVLLGDWALYAAGERMREYCVPENRIAHGDWCRYRRWLAGEED
jgi:gamma-glutamylcyclotransferase (GGCT)/AIG2-like uncharacterized protein YtfP